MAIQRTIERDLTGELEQLTRSIEVCLENNNRRAAHRLIDDLFNEHASKRPACLDLGDSVHTIVSQQTGNALEIAGYSTIGTLVHATRAQIEGIKSIGPGRVFEIYSALEKHGFIKANHPLLKRRKGFL